MSFDAETLRTQIPFYLTAAPDQKELVDNLKSLSEGAISGYYLNKDYDPYADVMLQGDGWPGFKLFTFDTGAARSVRGIVLSNSCDVSPENPRDRPVKVTFVPIVKLSGIRALWLNKGFSEDQIEGKLEAIRKQSISNVFYLPADGPYPEEYVALLDDLHSMPVSEHKESEKLFTLSMAGFYLFAFKLSVHFCRLQEQVVRKDAITTD